jgi:hypothetical protein
VEGEGGRGGVVGVGENGLIRVAAKFGLGQRQEGANFAGIK